jgi:hypothetical protein
MANKNESNTAYAQIKQKNNKKQKTTEFSSENFQIY